MSSPTEQFKSLVNTSDFVFVVYYRGHWCPFCESYLRDFGSIVPEIRTAGGTPIVITAEAEEHQRKFLEKTWCAADAIVDPENQIAGELAEKNLVNVAITDKAGYPHGMAQPAVLVLEKNASSPLYSWAIVPKMINLGGAKDRPSLGEVWQDVQKMRQDKMFKPRSSYNKQGIVGVCVGVCKQKIFG